MVEVTDDDGRNLEDVAQTTDRYDALPWPGAFRPSDTMADVLLPLRPLFALYTMADRFDIAIAHSYAIQAIAQHCAFKSLDIRTQVELALTHRVPEWLKHAFVSYVRRSRDPSVAVITLGTPFVLQFGVEVYTHFNWSRDFIFSHLRRSASRRPNVINNATCIAWTTMPWYARLQRYVNQLRGVNLSDSPCRSRWEAMWEELVVLPLMDDSIVPEPTAYGIQEALENAARTCLCKAC